MRGGSGKTIVSLGLIAAWRRRGYRVAPFKKGPDFIDAGWLAFAADRTCHNLDPFLMDDARIVDSFLSRARNADVSVIEGNRGLYDGLDLDGRCSTAELAKRLNAPVLIIVDVTMATRTTAALVKGCQVFDPDVCIAGVILNRVAGSRQETLVRRAVEKYCDTPVVGSVPKLKNAVFPERHMGLVPYQERAHAEKAIAWAESTVTEYLDLDGIWKIANQVNDIGNQDQNQDIESIFLPSGAVTRIGIIRDTSFWFYYPENLEHLTALGAELIELDALADGAVPPLDALYIGGGFPETQAAALADNRSFRESLRNEIEKGLPVYAECGGFMYLGERLQVGESTFPMVGALPVTFVLKEKPQGHGYTVLETTEANPYYPVGETVKGHEFHYSKAVITDEARARFAFTVTRGRGVDGGRDGMCTKNCLATYTHVHAGGNTRWAGRLCAAALRHASRGRDS